jgi:hypothetical protein
MRRDLLNFKMKVLTPMLLALASWNAGLAAAQHAWPNSLSVAAGGSGEDLRNSSVQLRLALFEIHYLNLALDQTTETLDGLELRTRGGSFSLGTDPIAEWSVEAGVDASGIADQYNIREPRIRLTYAPYALEGWDLSLEGQSASFVFANRPNILFSTSEVELQSRGLRFESGYGFRNGVSLRAWYEKTELSPDFDEMDRPLLAMVVAESAISVATAWAEERWGLSLGYARRKWSINSRVETQRAKVSREVSRTLSISGDLRWTKRFWNALRLSQTRSVTDAQAEPSGSALLEVGLNF